MLFRSKATQKKEMPMILAYRMFQSTDEFERWQLEESTTNEIVSVQPILSGMEMNFSEDRAIGTTPPCTVFVVFRKLEHLTTSASSIAADFIR